jgi:hypothetical protein
MQIVPMPTATATKQFRRPTKPFPTCRAKNLKQSRLIILLKAARGSVQDRIARRGRYQMALTSSKFSRCAWVIATTLVLALPTASQAYTIEQEEMCSGDAMRLCFSEIPNVDRITACMERQRESLSEGCRAVFEATTPAAVPAPAPVVHAAVPTAPAAHNKQAAKPAKPVILTPKEKRG